MQDFKLTIEPTGAFQSVEGVSCRLWRGTVEGDDGEVTLFIPLVKVDFKRFPQLDARVAASLNEVKPSRQLVSFDYRMVAD